MVRVRHCLRHLCKTFQRFKSWSQTGSPAHDDGFRPLRALYFLKQHTAAFLRFIFLRCPDLRHRGFPECWAGRHEKTWPTVLAQIANLDVVNLAQAGATTQSAMHKQGRSPPRIRFVILEIGGNDLLGDTTAAEFRDQLEKLLIKLAAADQALIMFDSPSPSSRTASAWHSVHSPRNTDVIIEKCLAAAGHQGWDNRRPALLHKAGRQHSGYLGPANDTAQSSRKIILNLSNNYAPYSAGGAMELKPGAQRSGTSGIRKK